MEEDGLPPVGREKLPMKHEDGTTPSRKHFPKEQKKHRMITVISRNRICRHWIFQKTK